VSAVTGSSLTISEQGGIVVTIQVAPFATIRVNGRAGSLSQIQPGYLATTVGVDGRPARRVDAKSPPVPPVLTTTTGRVRMVGPASLTLRVPGSGLVTVQVAPNAVIRVNGRPGTLAQIQPGYRATTMSANGAPARRVQATGPRTGGSSP
jgi:hypothetical protein